MRRYFFVNEGIATNTNSSKFTIVYSVHYEFSEIASFSTKKEAVILAKQLNRTLKEWSPIIKSLKFKQEEK